MSINSAVRATKLDKIFGTPVCAVLLAILCNVLWGSAFPFIKTGLPAVLPSTPLTRLPSSALRECGSCWAVCWCCWAASCCRDGCAAFPAGARCAAECCALGLWQTTTQYAFYYIAVAMLTGAFGGILNSTQSFLGVIFAHFIYGNADRMTPAKTLGCAIGFAGVLIGTTGQPRRRQRLGRVLHAGCHRHLHPVRPVEQVRHQKG